MDAKLYIVATPIGNLEDMTFRAVRILSEVDLIAAEDTRHTLKLLNYYGISKPLTSYFDHNQKFKGDRILSDLKQGKSVALVSDAGTPCVSDPGYNLVRDAIAAGIAVVPIPGASAVVAALSASGLPSDIFTFCGFPPSRQGKRRAFFSQFAANPGTLVFYEAPHRLLASLADLEIALGSRTIVVARELTKLYEEFIRGTASEIMQHFSPTGVKGEVAILVSPGVTVPHVEFSLEQELEKLLSQARFDPPQNTEGRQKGWSIQEAIIDGFPVAIIWCVWVP